MAWSKLHATVLCRACEALLELGQQGTMAFVRCLPSAVVEALSGDESFAPEGWLVRRVADLHDDAARTITADEAVELREAKDAPVVLLVDTERAGAGMDGIYSAAREVDEASLFKEAISLASQEVARSRSSDSRDFAEQAIKKARGRGQRNALPPWVEFDFLVRVATDRRFPGELLYLLGMWPVIETETQDIAELLDLSRRFVDRLLGPAVAGQTPGQRISALKLVEPSKEQKTDLERFLREAAIMPCQTALEQLQGRPHLCIGSLKVELTADTIKTVSLLPWYLNTGKLGKWSGLIEQDEEESPPELVLDPEADKTGNYSKLEVRWRVQPDNIAKGAVTYRVAIVTDMDEEITSREVPHGGKKEEKCRFSNDDFSTLSDDALLSAKVVLSVVGSNEVVAQESEEFQIRFGQRDEREPAGVGRKVRTLTEGLIELGDRELIGTLAAATERLPVDSKGYVLLRTPQRSKSFRVYSPPLIREVEQQWAETEGAIGRWRVRVRASGARAQTPPEFVPFSPSTTSIPAAIWERTNAASRRLAERFGARGGCGQIYDQTAKPLEGGVKEYLLAWAAMLEDGAPVLALANTVEVQSLSGRTIGLIVLPSHPLRMAWHVAYDNLVLHAAFEKNLAPSDVREELSILDGAMFPSFLPGVSPGLTFVFGDTLGFHSVGMVYDSDKEPKASLAILARALGDSETTESAPTVGRQSSRILGDEILKYIKCHGESRFLQVHALRAGDGLTVARSLGHVQQSLEPVEGEDPQPRSGPAFVLELYPSEEQRVVAGRFIAEAREKRRTGAGVLAEDDRWMLESVSLPGGISLPRLRWARKESNPSTAAHLAVAFDTFDSRVCVDDSLPSTKGRPLYVYGLLSFFERQYSSVPAPIWRSRAAEPSDGEKHPADRSHTDRIARLQQLIHGCVARNLDAKNSRLVLKAEISPEKAMHLRQLHRLCDWVITLDRNGGLEYFDSPRDNKDVYDAYVIDCVPEREDLGCLQLITSTSNLDEVRRLLDGALDQMGLSHSRRNAEFLMSHLKALSGRLAIRLTGQKAPTSELIALALSHAYSRQAAEGSSCWPSLRKGFIVPVDDVQDLLPPMSVEDADSDTAEVSRAVRPDLLYVSLVPRKGMLFRFIEVKYRRHLRDARSPDLLAVAWYAGDEVAAPFRAVRRAKLARVLRFYADKARRHADDEGGQGLSAEAHQGVLGEIDRMIEKGAEYSFASDGGVNLGWIFCPEYAGFEPLDISPADWETKIFLFGPLPLPDSPAPRPRVGDAVPATSGGPATDGPYAKVEVDVPVSSRAEAGVREEHAEKRDDSQTSAADEGLSVQAPIPYVEPTILLGKDLLTSADVSWPLTIKGNPHLLIAGLPGMGKTTCLLNICRQMVTAGVCPIVFSYHEDIDQRLSSLVTSIRFVDFQGLGFNPLKVSDRSSRLAYLDVAGTLRDIFTAIFPELGDIQGERLRNAIKQSFVEQGWDAAGGALGQMEEPAFKRFVEILRSDPKPDRGLRTLLARLEELADYGFFDLTGKEESIWDSQEPIIVRIHKTQNEVLQNAFASLVFYKLYKDMFRRGTQTRITHAVIFDEAHRAARLTLIPTMAKECRKYGISLVLASQEAHDFHTSLFSAIANYLVLRVTETDAKVLVRNVSSSDQERTLIDKIKQMEKFRALYFTEQRKKPSPVALVPD
jgi:DNA polymerase III delta prime subunit